jgi:hypothetical protein
VAATITLYYYVQLPGKRERHRKKHLPEQLKVQYRCPISHMNCELWLFLGGNFVGFSEGTPEVR